MNEVRRRDEAGLTEDEVAAWLKDRTVSFGDSVRVLGAARKITTAELYSFLLATETWMAATTRFHVTFPTGSTSEFRSPNGRTFAVGDTLALPNTPEPPHEAEPGRGTVWRVVVVEADNHPSFTGHLVVEAVKRLEPRE